MNQCDHSVSAEFRTNPDRFFHKDDGITLEETLDLPLNLSRMPSQINTISPTPLDPHALKVRGESYDDMALDHMMRALNAATEGIPRIYAKDILRAGQEIEYQHTHRMKKNVEAMARWREYAAADPQDKVLTHSEAEGVMQVRAGVSRIGAVLLLIARNPIIGAIETSKATRPFCATSHGMAKIALGSELLRTRASPDIEMEVDTTARPYRVAIDEHHGAFITKSLLGSVHVDGVELEIVGRESGLLLDPASTALSKIPESQSQQFGPYQMYTAPLDMTSYARLKSN